MSSGTPRALLPDRGRMLETGRLMGSEEMLRTRAWEVLHSPVDMGYRVVPGWGSLPEGWKLGQVAGVDTDSEDRVYLFHRGRKAPPLICFDSAGKVLSSWDHIDFQQPHMVTCDADDNVWLTDDGAHIIYKLSPHGETLSTLGVRGDRGSGELFDRPTDIAFNAQREMYVSDGYGANMRVAKFDPDGKFMLEWGEAGEGPGQFVLPHALTVDDDGLVYVADRNMWRVQVFDPDGALVTVWTHIGRPSDVTYVSPGRLFICDAPNARVTEVTMAGEVVGFFGELGRNPGQMAGNHAIAFLPNGDIINGQLDGRVQKFALSS
ncbi:hypothetical protein CMK11_19325 [Candidatus Poribacteria bacterium]|nr:hypothetical protein [Candidatus Poribacteria bacterium]